MKSIKFRFIDGNHDFNVALKNQELHVVGFAEVGMAFFRDYVVLTCGLSLDRAISVCEAINSADETGTLYPMALLTGLPVRFFRSEIMKDDKNEFLRCLKDAFKTNREYCKSNEMLFHYACAISNRNFIVDETIRMAQATDDPNLHTITIVVDEPIPLTELQQSVVRSPV